MKFFFIILALWLTPVWSAECWDFRFQETQFTACSAELPKDDVRLFLKDKNGKIFGQFQKLDASYKNSASTDKSEVTDVDFFITGSF